MGKIIKDCQNKKIPKKEFTTLKKHHCQLKLTEANDLMYATNCGIVKIRGMQYTVGVYYKGICIDDRYCSDFEELLTSHEYSLKQAIEEIDLLDMHFKLINNDLYKAVNG